MWRQLQRSVGTAAVLLVLAGCGLLRGDFLQGDPNSAAVVTDNLTREITVYLPGEIDTLVVNGLTETLTYYSLDQMSYSLASIPDEGDAVQALTLDAQAVWFDVTVLYRIDPAQVDTVHARWRDRYPDDLVRPMIRAFVRDVAFTFTAIEIYEDAGSGIQQAVADVLRAQLLQEGFLLDDFLIQEVQFSEAFTQALEAAQAAEDAQAAAEQTARAAQEAARATAESVRATAESVRTTEPAAETTPPAR